MKVYPIFLNDLSGRRCVVFGGNHEAERKVRELLECGAVVTVISAGVEFDVDELEVGWLRRDYRPGDLEGAFLAIAAETNPEKTRPIWEEAEARNVLFNAMDDVPHCSFVAGSVVRRGKLTVSISTSGAAPALAVRLRQDFEERFGPEFELFLDWMAALREPMADAYSDFDERRKIWYELVDSDVRGLLASNRYADAAERLREIVGEDVFDTVAETLADVRPAAAARES